MNKAPRITSERALTEMARIRAFQRARREAPDFDRFVQRLELLTFADPPRLGKEALVALYRRTVLVMSGRAIFGLSAQQALTIADHYCDSFLIGLQGRRFWAPVSATEQDIVSASTLTQIRRLGAEHGLHASLQIDLPAPTTNPV